MLGKITGIFTTAAPIGVATRDLTLAIGAILTVLGILGFLSEDQVTDLRDQVPGLLTAIGIVMASGVSIYRILTKSSSDKAAEAARQIDATVPADQPVEIKTPLGVPDIIVPAER